MPDLNEPYRVLERLHTGRAAWFASGSTNGRFGRRYVFTPAQYASRLDAIDAAALNALPKSSATGRCTNNQGCARF